MKKAELEGTVAWESPARLSPQLVPVGEARFCQAMALLAEFSFDAKLLETMAALDEYTSTSSSEISFGCNYTLVYFYRVHESSGMHDVAELVFNWSADAFFLMDIDEFVSMTRTLNATYPSPSPTPVSIVLYDAPHSMRRPGSLFDEDDDD